MGFIRPRQNHPIRNSPAQAGRHEQAFSLCRNPTITGQRTILTSSGILERR